jgi:D-glycerate 3-kinase
MPIFLLLRHLNESAQIKPSPSHSFPSQYSIIYQWRLEQEHNMKASNGGRGMSDEAVKESAIMFFYILPQMLTLSSFVDRYIPGYIFFGDIPASASFGSLSPCLRLRLLLDEARRLVGFEKF